jgi:hypothetical protein
MNLSYNNFEGSVSYTISKMDVLQLTMINQYGIAVNMKVKMERNSALVNEE